MSWVELATWAVAAICFAAGLFNAAGSQNVRQSFADYGYPRYWHAVTGLLEIVGAVLLILPQTRRLGALLLAVVLIAALATLVRHRDWKPLPACLLLAAGAIYVGLNA